MAMPSHWKPGVGEVGYPDNVWYEETTPTPFHIGQCYADTPLALLKCLTCGATMFEVGQGEYCTGIRCVTCGWESDIHNG